MRCRATSLASIPGPSVPGKDTRICFGLCSAMTWVAKMCSSSEVPQPKARVPSAPTVEPWLSGHASVRPRRGAASRTGGDGVVLHRNGEIGPANGPVLRLEALEGMGAVQLVHHMAIHVEKVAAIRAARRHVRIPDFIKHSLSHRVSREWR